MKNRICYLSALFSIGLFSASVNLGLAQDTCKIDWQGISWLSVSETISAGQYLVVRQDPEEVGCGLPFGVQALTFSVLNNQVDTLHLQLQPVIMEIDTLAGNIPGSVIHLGSPQLFDLVPFTSNGLVIPTDSTINVLGPFYAGLLFTSAPNGEIGVAVDDGSALRPGWSYTNSGSGWEDLVVDLGYTGNPILGSQGSGNSTDTVVEWRHTYWEGGNARRAIDIDYNFQDIMFLKVIAAAPGRTGNWHYPFDIKLTYDACKLYPGSLVPLTFQIYPKDAPGYEYKKVDGLAAELGFSGLHWGYNVATDLAENFIPPKVDLTDTRILSPSYVEPVSAELSCVGGLGVGFSELYQMLSERLTLKLTIVYPPRSILREARWQSTNSDEVYLWYQGSTPTTKSPSLVIGPYSGPVRIRVSAQSFESSMDKRDSIAPGVGTSVHLHKFPCLMSTVSGNWNWFPWGNRAPNGGGLTLNTDESDDLVWELDVGVVPPCQAKMIRELQDLSCSSFRASSSEYPLIDKPDTIVTVIKNIYDSVCSGYSAISIDYSLDEGGGPVPIGSRLLTTADAALSDFNAGVTDSITVEFEFAPSNPAYVFTESHQWLAGEQHPRYLVAISPTPLTPCAGWRVQSNLGLGTANDTARAAFSPPLPDFAIDSLHVESKLNLQADDTVKIAFRVYNHGESWPPHVGLSHSTDSVLVDIRVGFERKLAGNLWSEVYFDYFAAAPVTPMAAGGSGNFNVDYVMPTAATLASYGPFDRIRFVIEVNDGSTPLTATVWERNFDDNIAEYYAPFTTLPACIYPSDSLHVDGDAIDTVLPTYDMLAPCPQFVYLYVHDSSFNYVPPNIAPSALQVELGSGPTSTPPDDSSWSWIPAVFVKDFSDNNAEQYKVYLADLCLLSVGTGSRSYCLRASLDWQDLDPHHSYADANGFCFAADGSGGVNLFDGGLAGAIVGNPAGCCVTPGDANRDETFNISDVTFGIARIFSGGPAPPCQDEADANGDGSFNISDVTYGIARIFSGGPAPVCGDTGS